jgi:hypothetical protein
VPAYRRNAYQWMPAIGGVGWCFGLQARLRLGTQAWLSVPRLLVVWLYRQLIYILFFDLIKSKSNAKNSFVK